jgi:uncharacterized membrane protein
MSTQSDLLRSGTRINERTGIDFQSRQSRPASPSDTGVERFANALGWFSIGLGLAELLMPKKLGELIGAPEHSGVMRSMGLREIGAGIGILTQSQPAGWMQARVGGDMLDLALLGAAFTSDRSDKARLAIAAAAVGGVTALDILCSKQLSGGAGLLGRAPAAVQITETITVNRSREECYSFWRDFENMARIMRHLKSVRVTGENRSHWIAKAPAGTEVEWDAEITNDQPNECISWHSVEPSSVPNSGSVYFERAPGDRGTMVRVSLHYDPPGGKFAATIAKLFGEEPSVQVRDDLRRFKQVIETGEITTTVGQPTGPSLSQRLTSRKEK